MLTGAGRTGTWSALEPYGVVPDIMTLGKGIGGGYVPLSAVVAPRRIADVLAGGSGALLHAQTFSHHATLCAGGRGHAPVPPRSTPWSSGAPRSLRPFTQRLEALRELPCVGDVRGRGLLAGVEFVADPATRAPFPAFGPIRRVLRRRPRSMQDWWCGPMSVRPTASTAISPCWRRHSSSSHEEIDLIVQRFGEALRATVERIGAVA